jgi:hypothetical protein
VPKIYGELQDACLENRTTDPSATTTGRVWNNTTDNKIKTDDGTNKRALLRNDQNAVLGNSGTANNNVRLHRGAAETIQLVRGADTTVEGTMSTDLAKVSAKLESYTDAGKPAVGNAGRTVFLTDLDAQGYAAGAGALAVDNGSTWINVNKRASTSSHSAAYVAAIGDGLSFNDVSGAGYTITLPTAVGHNGERLSFQKTDATFNVVTIGAITTLNTQNEKVTLISNNTTWIVEERSIPSTWLSTTLSFNGPGITGITSQTTKVKRVGDSLMIRAQLVLTVAAGTGSFVVPGGLTMDTSKFAVNLNSLGYIFWASLGNGYTATGRWGTLYASGASAIEVSTSGSAGGFTPINPWNGAITSGSNNANTVFEAIIPISGWNG